MGDYDDVYSWLNYEGLSTDLAINEMQDEVYRVVREHIFTEDPCVLLYVGRKAAHLLNARAPFILDKQFRPFQLKVIQKRIIHMKTTLKDNEPVILFADTIHTGEEMSFVLRSLINKNFNIKKVVCYIGHESGIDSIIETGIIDKDSIVSRISTKEEVDYYKRGKPLQLFYRSRITPMDPDLKYFEYSTERLSESELVVKHIEDCISKYLHTKIKLQKNCEKGFGTGIEEYRYTCDDPKIINEILDQVFAKDVIDCHVITFLLKIKRNTNNLDFTLWVDPEIEIPFDCCNKSKEIFKDPGTCEFDNLETNLSEIDNKKILCPFCVGEKISSHLILHINGAIEGHKIQGINEIEQVYP